jgi:hypothetical protein
LELKMMKKPGTTKAPAEQVVKDIRRATRKLHSSEEKIRIVLSGLRGEDSIAELCRKEGGGGSANSLGDCLPDDGPKLVLQLVEGVPRGWQEAFGR